MVPYDTQSLWILVTGFIAAFLVAFGIGANDVANSFGTSVGSRVLTMGQACVLASIFELSGAILLGSRVSDTIRKGIVDVSMFEDAPKELLIGSLAALLAVFILLIVATLAKLPVSASHSIVGAVVGFALVKNSGAGIEWKKFGIIAGSWLFAPIISGIISCMIYYPVKRFILNHENRKKRGFFILPGFYAVTILINLISILFYGPPYIMNIPIWVRSIFLIGIPIIVAIIVQFAFIPRISKRIDKAYEDLEAEGKRYNIDELEIKMPNCFSICKKKKEVSTSNQSNDKGTNNLSFVGDFGEIKKKDSFKDEKVISSRIVRYDGTSIDIHDEKAKIIKNDPPEIFHIFAFLQTLTAIFTSFAHGGNDVSNSIGPLVTIWITWSQGVVTSKAGTPIWILAFGGVGISIGLWLLGWRVMRTVGKDLTKITPSIGFVIEFSAAFTVLIASKLGLPVSTTHCQVGAVIFTGMLENRKHVNLKLFGKIGLAWIVTVPIAGILSAGIFWCIKKILKI